MLAYILWGDRFHGMAQDARRQWDQSPMKRGFQNDGFGRTGNVAFDDYRARELKRLEEERARLDTMRAEFDDFLRELRRAKDQDEFDRFMAGLPAGVQLFSLFEANPQLIDLIAEICAVAPSLAQHLAGHSRVLDAVLDGGGNTNARDRDGSTPLHWACSAGRLRSVRRLLRRDDVDTGVLNEKGLTARDVSERESCAAAVIEFDATATVHNLAADGKLPMVRRALDDAWKSRRTTEEVLESTDAAGETMLHHACRNGRLEMVEALYSEYGANPDARSGVDGATPMHLAAAGGHVECMRVYAVNAGFPRRLQQRGGQKHGVALRVEDRELGSFRQRRGAHCSQLRRARPYQCARGEGEEAWRHGSAWQLCGCWLTGRSGRSDGQRSVNCLSGLETIVAMRLSDLATSRGRGAD